MPVAENKALVRKFNDDVWNAGNFDSINDHFASDWVWHSAPGVSPDREGLRQLVMMFRSAFSQIQATVEDQIAEEETVVWRWTMRAMHTGHFMGIPPTDKSISFTGISIDRLAAGRFVERWDNTDMMGLMQQLGAIPAQA